MGGGARAHAPRAGAARRDFTRGRGVPPRPGGESTGDGVHAVFNDALDAVAAALDLQRALADPATNGVQLQVRCGLHAGIVERRDNDFFGVAVNRAARIMAAAHGGPVLMSQAVAALLNDRLILGIALRDLGVVRLRDLTSAVHVYQLPVAAPAAPCRLPGIADARSDTEQLAATADFVHRAQTRADRSREIAGEDPPPDASGGGGHWHNSKRRTERARSAQPALQWTPQNVVAVANICRRLDGIPLALELAAARVRALSVEKIAARLNDRFSLLTRGDTTALPRQQTLRALITIVNTAVPAMAASLGVTPLSLKKQSWRATVSLAVGIPISGWIADRFGTR